MEAQQFTFHKISGKIADQRIHFAEMLPKGNGILLSRALGGALLCDIVDLHTSRGQISVIDDSKPSQDCKMPRRYPFALLLATLE